jgi:peptidoglycan hydrolase-like protein with peptidoglycan-binding domain
MRPASAKALRQRCPADAPHKVRGAEPRPPAVEHSADRIMNATHQQEPFSLSEFAAGSSAVAAVVLIAFVGVRASQPPNPPADNSLGAVGSPSASAELTQRRRHVPTATARARQGPPPSDVTMHVAEPSGDAAANDMRAAHAAATTGAPVSSFFAEAAPTTVVEMQSPTSNGAPPPLIGPPDLLQTKDAIAAPPERSVREAAVPLPPEPERNPSNRSDAIWIQTKLHDLGYFAGNGSGIWGPASRYALRDFKAMNGLAEDEKWDFETEHRLVSKQNVPASSTFIGGWAQSAEECQHFRGAGAPLVIRSRGAETESVKCSFKSLKRELATAWRAQATCSAGGQSWNSNVSLKLTGSSLNWSSEVGKETYVRCVRP